MVSFLYYFIIGIVQGTLEWIPISSEGQLVAISVEVFNLEVETALKVAIWLHIGTLLSVLVKYRKDWVDVVTKSDIDTRSLRALIIYSTLGTAIIAIPLRLVLFRVFKNPVISSLILVLIGISLLITSRLLWISKNTEAMKSINDLTKMEQLVIGFAQGLSIIPGISRSGTTISAFLLLKTDKNDSFKGSFIISVPAVIGAIGFDILLLLLDKESFLSEVNPVFLLISIAIAFIVGYLTIELLLNFAEKYDFSIIAAILGIFLIFVAIITIAI